MLATTALVLLSAAPLISLESVSTTPGVKESVMRPLVEARLAALEACVPELLVQDDLDERVWVDFTVSAPRCRGPGTLRIRGPVLQACATRVFQSLPSPKSVQGCDVEVSVHLKLTVDRAQVLATWAKLNGEAAELCERFLARLKRPGTVAGKPVSERTLFDAALLDFAGAHGGAAAPADLASAGLEKLTVTRDLREQLVTAAGALSSERPALLLHAFADLGVPSWCPDLRRWYETRIAPR